MRAIVASGAEVACHGYAHEDAARLTPAQERDVVKRCVEVLVEAGAPRPVGWRAPLYSVREGTLDLLQELGFEYGWSAPHAAGGLSAVLAEGADWIV